jgi:hypothetical protein
VLIGSEAILSHHESLQEGKILGESPMLQVADGLRDFVGS